MAARRRQRHDVIAGLPANRELAYTSVSTILRILETKSVLEARKEGRGHVYVPLLGKADYEARAVRDVVERVFQGVPVALVRQLLDSGEMTATDLREVRKLARPRQRAQVTLASALSSYAALNVALAVGALGVLALETLRPHQLAPAAFPSLLDRGGTGRKRRARRAAALPRIHQSERQHLVVATISTPIRRPQPRPSALRRPSAARTRISTRAA